MTQLLMLLLRSSSYRSTATATAGGGGGLRRMLFLAGGGKTQYPRQHNVPIPTPTTSLSILRHHLHTTQPSLLSAAAAASSSGHPAEQLITPADTTIKRNKPADDATQRAIYNEIVNRKRTYREQLRSLRKAYAEEVKTQRAADEKARADKQRKLSAAKAERQRLKNLRSIESAKRVAAEREVRRKEWEAELVETQKRRDARKQRFRKARRLLLDELEAECHLWMTTHEEVEAALGGVENMQRLWVRPHSLVGAMPDDATFWRYSGDTWRMEKTYLTPAEHVLQQLEEAMYDDTNMDQSYWSSPSKENGGKTRMEEALEKEEKARLRAMVGTEAVKHLVHKAVEEERQDMPNPNIAHLLPKNGRIVPPNHPLRDHLAAKDGQTLQQMENAVALNRHNLQKFFDIDEETGEASVKPHEGWPLVLGRMPPPDTRTEKEKARQKKIDDAAWAAVDTAVGDDEELSFLDADSGTMEAAAAAEEEEGLEAKKKDYEEDEVNLEEIDDPLWLDIATGSPEEKLDEDDVDWLIAQLEKKAEFLQEAMEREAESGAGAAPALGAGEDSSSSGIEAEMDSENVARAMGILNELTEEQQDEIATRISDDDIAFGGEDDVPRLVHALEQVDGLSQEQIQAIVDVELAHVKGSSSGGGSGGGSE